MPCVYVCVFVCAVCPSSALSDGDSEFFQHADSFLLVLLPGQPEVVLVLHDVGQHGSAQEHHVLSPGRILDPDLKFLQDKGTHKKSLCNCVHTSVRTFWFSQLRYDKDLNVFLISVKFILHSFSLKI